MGYWRRTDKLEGYEPEFEVKCFLHGKDMVLRYSQLCLNRSRVWGMNEPAVDMAYKCPDCGLIERFMVSASVTGNDDEEEYIWQLFVRRKGSTLYLPPKEEWEQNEEIKKRLQSLGYF